MKNERGDSWGGDFEDKVKWEVKDTRRKSRGGRKDAPEGSKKAIWRKGVGG